MLALACTSASRCIVLLSALLLSGHAVLAQGSTDHWLGWYGGGTVGIAWTDVDIHIPPDRFSDSYEGFTGGLIGGYNGYVTDRRLVGVEADITFSDVMGGFTLSRHKASLLARAGWFRSPSMLLFGVAGLAGGQYKAKVKTTATTTQVIFDDEEEFSLVTTTMTAGTTRNKRLWGYTVGAGFEREGQLNGRDVRWGMEYRFTDFEDWNLMFQGQKFSFDPEVHELRFRLVVPLQNGLAVLSQ